MLCQQQRTNAVVVGKDLLELPPQSPPSGRPICESPPQSYRSWSFEETPESSQRQAPQCCPQRLSDRCLVLYITCKQTVPSPEPPLQQTWALVGAQGSQRREGEAGARPHTSQVVNCWLWFSWKALKWLSEHSLLGPCILWQGCHDPRGVASKPYPLGCFVGCFAAWHRDPGLTDLLPPKPTTQEMLGPFLFILEMHKSLQSSTMKRSLSLSFRICYFESLHLLNITPSPKDQR